MHLKQVFRAMGIKTMTNSIQKQFESSTQFSSDIQESLLWNEYLSFWRDVLQHSISYLIKQFPCYMTGKAKTFQQNYICVSITYTNRGENGHLQ